MKDRLNMQGTHVKFRRPRRLTLRTVALTMGALSIATAVGITPVFAFGPTATCTPRAESKPFAKWGDSADYFLVPNGTFEETGEWQVSGPAGLAEENEPFNVAGAGKRSMEIGSGGSVESRTICVTLGEEIVRFFVKNPGVYGSLLHVEAVVGNPKTKSIAVSSFDISADSMNKGWGPSNRLSIPNVFNTSGTQELTLTFTASGANAAWRIDDVYVDPFKSY